MSNLGLLLLLAALWSPAFLFVKVGLEDFPPVTVIALRLGIAAVVLFIGLRSTGQSLPRGWSAWKRFAIMGLFGNAVPFVLFSLGEQVADSGLAAVVYATAPIFTVLLAHLLLHDERLTLIRVIGVVVGFLGVVTLFLPTLAGAASGGAALPGLVAFALATISVGLSFVYARSQVRGYPPLVASTAQIICAAAFVIPVALIFERPFASHPHLPAIAAILALAILGTVVAYTVYYRLIQRTSATYTSFATYIMPPASLALGVTLLDERPGWNALLGCVLILAGVMIVNNVQRFARRAPAGAISR